MQSTVLETYQLERGLAAKESTMMDDSTYSTVLDSSGSYYSGVGYRRYRYDHSDYDNDDGSSASTTNRMMMKEQHDDIYHTSASSSFDDDDDDDDINNNNEYHDYGDTTSVMLDDDLEDDFYHLSNRDSSIYEDIDLLPTFNAMIIQSQSIAEENICATAIVEKEREDLRRQSQLPSALFQEFAKARVDTFTRNLEYIATNFEDNTTIDSSSDSESEQPEPSWLSLETVTTTKKWESGEEVVEEEEVSPSSSTTTTTTTTRRSQAKKDEIPSPNKKEEDDQITQLSKNFNHFLQDRMDTFSRNMVFAQAQAEAWKQSFTSDE